jgi:transcription elongation GreA/GreB family factor
VTTKNNDQQGLKQQLYQLCLDHLLAKIAVLQASIAELQDAIGNETKSSAGDKYETTREMLNQDINIHGGQLSELNQQRAALDKIPTDTLNETVVPGSIVTTNRGNYYIAVSAGSFTIADMLYYAISAASPIGKILMGQKVGCNVVFNGKAIVIMQVL